MKTTINRLTDLELEIMKVMWDKDEPLTIQEMSKHFDTLSVPSITQAIKHLLNKGAVVVTEYVLVSNVYARTFKPTYTAEEYYEAACQRLHTFLFGDENECNN